MSVAPVEFFFDFVSPYAYLGSTQIDAVAARHGRTVEWKPVLIGITILKIMGMKPQPETPLKGDYLRHDVPRVARLFGVPFNYHKLTGVNSVAACRAFLWIGERDAALARRFAHAIFKRLWVDGRDITPVDAVVEVASSLGVPAGELREALGTEAIKATLKNAVDYAVSRGVFGVPFFIADGEPFWGGDRLWMLEHWLEHGTWDRLKG
jgi:2-hydroxychromene-2-carboxylate isomerase